MYFNRDPFEDKMKKKQFIFHPFFPSFFFFSQDPLFSLFLISRASIFFFLIFLRKRQFTYYFPEKNAVHHVFGAVHLL